jgi:endonuclease/exonuclease/phosphatase family metal-dependent hydrolase
MANQHAQNRDRTGPVHLRILQLNLNKSEKAHLDFTNNIKKDKWDIILVQEPHTTKFNAIRTPTNFRPVLPQNRGADDSPLRSVIWVSSALETQNWKFISIPDTNDLTAIQLKGEYGTLAIFNIYNDCTNANTENALNSFLRKNANDFHSGNRTHMIWAGDFNRHHPMWDRDEDTRLFTSQSQREATKLISLLAEHDMTMPLPKGIPTLQHMVSKLFSRPDNVFCSAELQEMVTKCDTDISMRPPCTDHFPIATHITLMQTRTSGVNNYNFRDADWERFRKKLTENLDKFPLPAEIDTETDLNSAA